jgi:hypothetical protein
LIAVLARQGLERLPDQTPLEFAATVGLKEAETITVAYNRVRFGAHRLSIIEQREIHEILKRLESS